MALGHGEIFTLDLDRVIDAPWRNPTANPSDYFNYGMNERTWREYCRKVEQYRCGSDGVYETKPFVYRG